MCEKYTSWLEQYLIRTIPRQDVHAMKGTETIKGEAFLIFLLIFHRMHHSYSFLKGSPCNYLYIVSTLEGYG